MALYRTSGESSLDPLKELSVVIPVAPGERRWRDLLNDLLPLPEGSEVILVGPESLPENEIRDFTSRALFHLRYVHSVKGRAAQLNKGGFSSQKKYLWFLHADTKVPKPTLTALKNAFIKDGSRLYFFELQFLDDGPKLMTLNSLGANWRSTVLGLPFGDQGFALSRETFLFLGGFDENAPYGEDHVFVWEARRKGVPVRRIKAPLFTSARKYEEHGWGRTTGRHVWLTAKQAMCECVKTFKGRLFE